MIGSEKVFHFMTINENIHFTKYVPINILNQYKTEISLSFHVQYVYSREYYCF